LNDESKNQKSYIKCNLLHNVITLGQTESENPYTVIHIRVEIFLRQMRIAAHAPQSNFFCELGIPFPFGRGAGGGGGV